MFSTYRVAVVIGKILYPYGVRSIIGNYCQSPSYVVDASYHCNGVLHACSTLLHLGFVFRDSLYNVHDVDWTRGKHMDRIKWQEIELDWLHLMLNTFIMLNAR